MGFIKGLRFFVHCIPLTIIIYFFLGKYSIWLKVFSFPLAFVLWFGMLVIFWEILEFNGYTKD